MVTANELLASLTGTDDKVCVIDLDTRVIHIPNTITALGVEADDDVHKLQFQMPQTYCGEDLSKFAFRINYMNAANDPDIYEVVDKSVSNGVITFSWCVGPNALKYKGNVNFIVCLKITKDGVIDKELNTTVATLPVLEGLEVDVEPLSEPLSDILAQLTELSSEKLGEISTEADTQIKKLQTESSAQQENIVNKGKEVLATIGMVRSRANAITKTAEGEVVTTNDSSDDYLRNLRVFGKSTQVATTGRNLLDASKLVIGGITVNGNRIVVSPMSTGTAVTSPYTLGETLAAEVVGTGSLTLSGVSTGLNYIYIIDTKTFWSFGSSIDLTESMLNSKFWLYGGNAPGEPAVITDLMVYYPDDPFDWEPYSGGKSTPNPEYPQDIVSIDDINVYVYGKNLVRTNYGKTETYEGLDISFTKGSAEVHLNGTTTKSYGYAMSHGTYLTPGRYTMSVWGLNTVSATHDNAYLMNADTREVVCDNVKTGSPVTFDVTASGTYRIDFVFANGTTYNNATVRFQIEAGDMATDYEPIADRQDFGISHTLRGIPVTSGGNYTDANGQQWVCDEIDFENGKYIQRVNILQLNGAAEWDPYINEQNNYAGFMIWHALDEVYNRSVGFCNQVPKVGLGADKCVWVGVNDDCLYVLTKEWYNKGVVAWKAHLNDKPLEIVYLRNTPNYIDLTDDELTAFSLLHSNYPTTTVMNDAGAWTNVKYNADTKTYVDDKANPSVSSVSIPVLRLTRIFDHETAGENSSTNMTPAEVYDYITKKRTPVLYTAYDNLNDPEFIQTGVVGINYSDSEVYADGPAGRIRGAFSDDVWIWPY